jgi:hypothetical protein
MRMTLPLSTKLYIPALGCSPKIFRMANPHGNKVRHNRRAALCNKEVQPFSSDLFWVESKEKLP